MFVDLKQNISEEGFILFKEHQTSIKISHEKLDNHNIWITRGRVSVLQLYDI